MATEIQHTMINRINNDGFVQSKAAGGLNERSRKSNDDSHARIKEKNHEYFYLPFLRFIIFLFKLFLINLINWNTQTLEKKQQHTQKHNRWHLWEIDYTENNTHTYTIR